MRYFEVIIINDKNARTFIDGIRLFAASKIKHQAHVTLRGPFNDEEIHSARIRKENQIVTIERAGNFFNENQNTVFFKCFLQSRLKSMMDKPNFGNANPHITIYDGDNREYARQIYDLLQKHPVRFQIIVNELGLIHSKNEYMIFNDDFYDHLSYYMGKSINENKISSLTKIQRLEYIEELLLLFNNWQNKNVIPNPSINIINKLNYSEQNGLFFYDDIEKWEKFPTRIIQAIHQIKPYAFFTFQRPEKQITFDHNLPFVFIFSNPSVEEENKIKRDTFNFGNAPIVIIHQRNNLKVLNGLIFNGTYDKPELEYLFKNSENIEEIAYDNLLTSSFWDKYIEEKKNKNIYNSFLSNISQIRSYLITYQKLSGTICNKLIGRLLFIRYFIDRGVSFIKDDGTPFFSNIRTDARREFAELINNKERLYYFFYYFKKKYKGDLFPIDNESDEFRVVKQNHLNLLSELFRGGEFSTNNKNLYLQRSLFDVYDFSIIPVELVSNVYEHFMDDIYDKKKSIKIKNKAFYTPYFLADFVLENSIEIFLRNTLLKEDFICPVLDPSCGSGIFLVESLRRIIDKKIKLKERSLTNEELWECVSNNIFGIDIDSDAIDIAIFSIYVTILDYVEPKEISKDFCFKNLKEKNFFTSDFFNMKHYFNDIIVNKDLKFIIGNPPWGQLNNSPYLTYCREREKKEMIKKNKKITIGISDNQIAQAFLIRVSDFFQKETKCAFVITSKVLYNSNTKQWRSYFFNEFSVNQIYDFSPVRTFLFEDASWPTMIIFYSKMNIYDFEYFSISSREFSKRFNNFSVNQQSKKRFSKDELIFLNKNYSWFWKTMLYGSYFDFLIIKKLKENFKTIFDIIQEYNLYYGVGLKRKDGNKRPDSSNLVGYKFIDTQKKELKPFMYNSSTLWNDKTAGNIPKIKNIDNFPILFIPPMALIKEGLTPDIKGVAAFCNEKIIFTHSIRAIKGTQKNVNILKSIVGLINSNMFSYYILHTGSSVGVDITRANQIEQFSFPVVLSEEISYYVDNINKMKKSNTSIQKDKENVIRILNEKILEKYNLKNIELDFIKYTLEYNIKSLKSNKKKKIAQLTDLKRYENIFKTYFDFNKIMYNVFHYIDNDKKFIGFFIVKISNDSIINNVDSNYLNGILNFYFRLSIGQIPKLIFLKKTITEINREKEAYCIIKSVDSENWQNANAWLDLVDFIKEMINPDKNLHKIYEDVFNFGITV